MYARMISYIRLKKGKSSKKIISLDTYSNAFHKNGWPTLGPASDPEEERNDSNGMNLW